MLSEHNVDDNIKSPAIKVWKCNFNYVNLDIFETFYEDCIDFKDSIREKLDEKFSATVKDYYEKNPETDINRHADLTTHNKIQGEKVDMLSAENEKLKGERKTLKIIEPIINKTSDTTKANWEVTNYLKSRE